MGGPVITVILVIIKEHNVKYLDNVVILFTWRVLFMVCRVDPLRSSVTVRSLKDKGYLLLLLTSCDVIKWYTESKERKELICLFDTLLNGKVKNVL
jgi:hypothetical protein